MFEKKLNGQINHPGNERLVVKENKVSSCKLVIYVSSQIFFANAKAGKLIQWHKDSELSWIR